MLPLSPRDFSAETTSNITFNKRGKFREKEHTYKLTHDNRARGSNASVTRETFVLCVVCIVCALGVERALCAVKHGG